MRKNEKNKVGERVSVSVESDVSAVPSGIFRDRNLAPLESISEYLKEAKNMTYHEIAEMLKRDDRTIWTCYNRAKKKRVNSVKSEMLSDGHEIPLDIFHNRELAPLEGISKYLKESKNMSFHEIAILLNRDDRTIWTCYNRSKKKIPSGG